MHPAIRQNNVLASNLYFASCLFALIQVAITMHTELSQKVAEMSVLYMAMAMFLSFYLVIQYLFGIGMRRGVMWVKIVFLTVTLIGALAYLIALFSPTSQLHSNYNTPVKAVLLSADYFLSLWTVVLIFQGFGISDRISWEPPAQPVAGKSADAGAA